MKVLVVFSLLGLALGGSLNKRECAGNNCNRQVTGTRPGLPAMSIRKADCSSFMLTTVTPSPVTTTVTATVTDEPLKLKRDALEIRQLTVMPSFIPAYASSCDNHSEYSSACSCFGVTAMYTTAPTPTNTVTVTTTVDYCEDL